MKMPIPEISSHDFTWSRWRAFNLFDKLGIPRRTYFLIQLKHLIKKYAVGYMHSEKLSVRPKTDCYAVMFFVDDMHSWCHVTAYEFNEIFVAL